MRISPRGPIRLAVLVTGAVLVTIATGTAVMAAMAAAFSLYTLLCAAVAATGLFLLLRGWVVGTYVTDTALVIETTFNRRSLPWPQVSELRAVERPCPFLGLPVLVRALRVVAADDAGRPYGTHVYASSPDYWLRAEAFDMAALRLERWRQHG